MADRAVIDTNVLVKLVLKDALTPAAETVAQHYELHAPDIIVSETGNTLWKSVRFAGLLPKDAQRALAELTRLVELADSRSLAPRALEMAIMLTHPFYYCLYAALAEREKRPLITADKSLIAKVAAGFPNIVLIDLNKLPDPLP
jgi:predicted nucleic acid-binding protein